MNNTHHRFISILLLLLGLAACYTTLAGPPVKINSADPPEAPQNTNDLTVTINGGGFDTTPGAVETINFLLPCDIDCEDTGGVEVTSFVVHSTKKITATIDIEVDAVVEFRDIEVRMSRGRGGKGTTLFKVQSSNSHEDQIFEVTFEGAVVGTAISEPISILGNVQIIGFYAFSGEITFHPDFISQLEVDGYTGFSECFGNEIGRFNIQIYEDYVDRELTLARFWFFAPDSDDQTDDSLQYALDLSDTGGEIVWSGQFPPAKNETIYRTAESWGIRPTKKKVKTACSGEGDFEEYGGYEVKVTLTRIE